MNQLLFILTIIIFFGYYNLYAQQQLILNSGFETGTADSPTGDNELDKCNDWSGTGGTTPDWYTTLNFTSAFHGYCPNQGGTTGYNSGSLMSTYDGSSYYAGFGSGEGMITKLSRKTYANSKVKLSFWFSPRGEFKADAHRTRNINARLRLSSGGFFRLVSVPVNSVVSDGKYLPCNWYYFESTWLNTDDLEYDEFIIGGGEDNPAGDLYSSIYFYIDDIRLYNGKDCCPDFYLYENISNLPALTHVEDYIIAGYDAGISNTSGEVIIQGGQNVTFKGGSYIDLLPGFYVEPGAIFDASIEECSPFTHPTGTGINIISLPNFFTPNNDGVNDEYCIESFGASHYTFKVSTRDMVERYSGAGTINNNFSCIWDGKNNNGIQLCNDVYFGVLTLTNCDKTVSTNPTIDITGVNCKAGNYNDTTSNANSDTNTVVIDTLNTTQNNNNNFTEENKDTTAQNNLTQIPPLFPNPFHSITNITYTIMQPQPVTLTIKNILGKEVARLINNETQDAACYKKEFDASLLKPGVYFYVLQTGSSIETQKMVKISE